MIDESFHIPVLTEEVIEYLIRKKDGHYLDATAGFGVGTPLPFWKVLIMVHLLQ